MSHFSDGFCTFWQNIRYCQQSYEIMIRCPAPLGTINGKMISMMTPVTAVKETNRLWLGRQDCMNIMDCMKFMGCETVKELVTSLK